MSLFMKATNIDGSASGKGYKNWSELHNLRFLMTRDIPLHVGKNDPRHSVPKFDSVSFLKTVDASSPALSTAMCKNIDMCRTGDTFTPYLQYTLHNVLVSHIESFMSASSGAQEKILLNYTKIEKRFTPTDSAGRSQSSTSVGYDLPQAQSV